MKYRNLLTALAVVASLGAGFWGGKLEERSMNQINLSVAFGDGADAGWKKGYEEGGKDTKKAVEEQAQKDVNSAIEAVKKNLKCEQKNIRYVLHPDWWYQFPTPPTGNTKA